MRPRWRFAQSLVTPGEAQRSGFAGKRRSKGTNAVFAARRKRSGVDFATTSRHGQSRSPPALRPQARFGAQPPRQRRLLARRWRRNPPAGNGRIRTLPPHPPPSGAPDPIPSGLRPSPLDKGSRPPGGRLSGGPVCRPYGEREDFRAVRTPPLREKEGFGAHR